MAFSLYPIIVSYYSVYFILFRAAGSDKSAKYALADFVCQEKFGMPLDGPHEAAFRHADRLNQAVAGPGHGFKPGRQCLNALMVVTIYVYDGFPDEFMQGASLLRFHSVGGYVIRRALHMGKGAGYFRGNVLIQGPAKKDIEKLYASAYSQGAFIEREDPFFKKDRFHDVPFPAHRAATSAFFFTVKPGEYIVASGEKKAVAYRRGALQEISPGGKGQHERQSPRRLYAFHIAG
jgi:hypothetical protein